MDSDIEIMNVSLDGVAPSSILGHGSQLELVATAIEWPGSSVPTETPGFSMLKQAGTPHRVSDLPFQVARWQGAYCAPPAPR